MHRVFLGYGDFEQPDSCWGVMSVGQYPTPEEAEEAAEEAYEGNLKGNPDAQYLWVITLAPGKTHPCEPCV